MELSLLVGDFAYSSWSLRGWLLLDAFGISFRHQRTHMRTEAFAAMLAEAAPARTVPTLRITPTEGAPWHVWDSLAIAEEMAEMHPRAGLWPADPRLRGAARSMAAEMHSGFTALRGACPMNMRRCYAGFETAPEVAEDLARLATIWSHARKLSGTGPFLFGAFCAADAFFAPVASRIATYDLAMGEEDLAYVAALLAHPSVRRWRAMAMADGHVQAHYEFGLPERPDPHAPPLTGTHVKGVAAENASCPYSGRPVDPDSIMQVGPRVIGYCNTFCRAKSEADPMAWPETAALLGDQAG